MLPQHVLLALVASVAAVPLNINLGAYSPALVVGDGEISLGSTESASKLMATLASGAAENGNAAQQAKRGNVRRALDTIFGKREPAELKLAAVENAMEWIKRDLAGFNAALSYAKEAQKDSPKIELGSEGAGVGIVVNPGVNVPKGSAAAGAEKVKRDEVVSEDDAPKMTLVAITEV
ncbi:hypothetical protein ACN47E_004501 [Coniothyrium glycines]